MIKVSNLDKTYYKGKSNEIHVINDSSLELPNTGLVFFLGQSGSGKTTLLNAIGGLDKADKGSIQYDDTLINKYNMSKVDKFRSTNIGYIFQNYLLIESLSVYENLRLALELIGINDPEEVKKRIEYVLKSVGLYKFRKKLAGQLSGGQQQRVSIARALIKKTKIIIADEPTGNLDSENTIEVMNILKKVSKETLVLVVTHNEEIASFYADRIVKLKDGRIESDIVNESTGSLEAKSDRKIHLLDLKESNVSEGRLSVKLYTDDEESLHNVTIVIKNNTIFIDSETRLQVVPGSNIELINDHYKKLELEHLDSFDYDVSWYNDNAKKNKMLESIKDLGRLFAGFYSSSKRKFFNVVFILIGITIAILVLLQTNFAHYDTTGISNEPNYYCALKDNEWGGTSNIVSAKDVLYAFNNDLIDDFEEYSYMNFSIEVGYNAVNSLRISPKGRAFDYSNVKDLGLYLGSEPVKPNQLVIGKSEAKNIIDEIGNGFTYKDIIGLKDYSGDFTIVGISNADTNSIYHLRRYNGYVSFWDLDIDESISLFSRLAVDQYTLENNTKSLKENEIIISEGLSYYHNIGEELNGYKIVDIINDMDDIKIFTEDYKLLQYKYDPNSFNVILKDYSNLNSSIAAFPKDFFEYTIKEGRDASSDTEAVASVYTAYNIGSVVNGLTIVGKYEPKEYDMNYSSDSTYCLTDTRWILATTKKGSLMSLISKASDKYGDYDYVYYSSALKISDDKLEAAAKYFESQGYTLKSKYQVDYDEIVEDANSSKKVFPIIEAVLLAVIIVYTYFSERAKMINEVYDIGVLRSLGAKRSKITLRVIKELFVKATLTTLLGYILAILVYLGIAKQINGIMETTLLHTNVLYILLGVVILYASQILIGLLPYGLLLRKTPSEINSKYDI